MPQWKIVSDGAPVAKRGKKKADDKRVEVRKAKRAKQADRAMTQTEIRKALKDELDRQIKELTPAERGELVKAMAGNGISEQVRSIQATKGHDDELEPGDRGGGIAAIEVERADGSRARLDKEAGDPTKHVAKKGGVSYARALAAEPIRQQNGPARRPRGGGAVRRLLD